MKTLKSLFSGRLLIVLAGIIAGQALLFGPSLVGRRILLPLDLLVRNRVYLPANVQNRIYDPAHQMLSDRIYVYEPARRFAVSELHAGRLPAWNPYQYAGAPFIWSRFSPFLLFQCLTASPVILAWGQMLVALVAGLGTYLFCRRALGLRFWPGVLASWCYPLTGFFILWQGIPISLPVCWLPWILLAVHETVRAAAWGARSAQRGPAERDEPPPGWPVRLKTAICSAPIGLSLTTCLVLVSGQLDIAAQVLIVSGFYACWCLMAYRQTAQSAPAGPTQAPHLAATPAARTLLRSLPTNLRHRQPLSLGCGPQCSLSPAEGERAGVRGFPGLVRETLRRIPTRAALRLAAGWGLGLLLAASAVLPVVEYAQTGVRMSARAGGDEDRPPGGPGIGVQILLPDIRGRNIRLIGGNQLETPAAGYAGVAAALLAAPLAWSSRRHRSVSFFWAGLIFFGLSWSLAVPGMVQLLRLPGLRMLSHNRWVFAASFAIIALAAIGLDALFAKEFRWRWWCWAPAGALAGLCLWSGVCAAVPPEAFATRIRRAEQAIMAGQKVSWALDLQGVREVQSSFVTSCAVAAALCGAGLIGWLILWRFTTFHVDRTAEVPLAWAVAAAMLGDLLWFGHGRSPQCDPALYYPPIPVLDQIGRSAPGRTIGFGCLPANLATVCRLRDIRGMDGVNPARLVELMGAVTVPPSASLDAKKWAELGVLSKSSQELFWLMQYLQPRIELDRASGELRLHPLLDMLAVRYVVFRQEMPPGSHPAFEDTDHDYRVAINPSALDRVYVPERVEVVPDRAARLQMLTAPSFNPRQLACVESSASLPPACRGQAVIIKENPADIIARAKMETEGLVVLADLWDSGWRAYLNGTRVPILKTNHAIRGVVVPKGESLIEFRYEPASFRWGLNLAAGAGVVLAAWLVLALAKGQNHKTNGFAS